MAKFEMFCGCYFANKGFKIGKKYVTVYNIYTHKVYGKMELSPAVILRLEEIKKLYRYEDCRRTREVCNFVCKWDEEELYEEAFV